MGISGAARGPQSQAIDFQANTHPFGGFFAQCRLASVTRTVTDEPETAGPKDELDTEPVEFAGEKVGGAGRGRTAASQFCRLLP